MLANPHQFELAAGLSPNGVVADIPTLDPPLGQQRRPLTRRRSGELPRRPVAMRWRADGPCQPSHLNWATAPYPDRSCSPARNRADRVLCGGHVLARATFGFGSDVREGVGDGALHSRDTCSPHQVPSRQRSVPSSPTKASSIPSSRSPSSKVSVRCGTGPRTSRKGTRSGGSNRTVSAVVTVRRSPSGVKWAASTMPLRREHLELCAHRSWGRSQVWGGDHLEHNLPWRTDGDACRAEPADAAANSEIQRQRTADDERVAESTGRHARPSACREAHQRRVLQRRFMGGARPRRHSPEVREPARLVLRRPARGPWRPARPSGSRRAGARPHIRSTELRRRRHRAGSAAAARVRLLFSLVSQPGKRQEHSTRFQVSEA